MEELEERLPFITKRLRLRDSRRRQFTAIFEHAVDAIIIINMRGIINRFNKAAENIFGYLSDEVMGKECPRCLCLIAIRENTIPISRIMSQQVEKR